MHIDANINYNTVFPIFELKNEVNCAGAGDCELYRVIHPWLEAMVLTSIISLHHQSSDPELIITFYRDTFPA